LGFLLLVLPLSLICFLAFFLSSQPNKQANRDSRLNHIDTEVDGGSNPLSPNPEEGPTVKKPIEFEPDQDVYILSVSFSPLVAEKIVSRHGLIYLMSVLVKVSLSVPISPFGEKRDNERDSVCRFVFVLFVC
jgi:hypothetical protein